MPRKDQDSVKAFPFDPRTTPDLLLRKMHSVEGKFASFVSGSAGNMWFVYLHIFWFTFWFFANNGDIPQIQPFDPFPYGLLTMVVSLEAIFLSTFILINQNRQALVDTYRDIRDETYEGQAQEELEEDVQDIQKDIDDIKSAMSFIQGKLTNVEKAKAEGNGNGGSHT